MIASSYIVNVYDKDNKLLDSSVVFSYDEAFWQIDEYIERYKFSAVRYEIVLPAEKIIKNPINRKEKTE